MNQLPQQFGGLMTFAKSLKDPQSLRLDISNANLNITPEQFERLCVDNPDLSLALTEDGQLFLTPPEIINKRPDILKEDELSLEEDPDTVHTVDSRGEPLTYNVKDLYWDTNAYSYIQEQEKKFQCCLTELAGQYGGQYVIFENGLILDSDIDEMTLLIRISENLSYRDRPAIFCKFIPLTLEMNKLNA
jgi:hypothetical protein